MLKNIIRCGLLALVLHIARVSSGPIDQPSGDPIRQAKATEMLKYLNEYADPCVDFYEFTCGNWNTYNPAELSDQLTTGLLETLHEALDDKIKLLLVTDDSADTAIDKKVKDFYRSCVNLLPMKRVYAEKLKDILGEFGEMPALVGDYWREEDFDWLQTIAKIAHMYGLGIITDASVNIDIADNSVNRLYIGEQELALEAKSVYLDQSNVQFVRNFMQIVATKLHLFLGLEVNLAVQTAKEIVEFEGSLAKGTADPHVVQQITDLYTLSTMEELHQKYSPELDLKKLVSLTLGSIPDLEVYYNGNYTDNLVETLKVTPKRVVANYIFYQLLDKFRVEITETEEEQHDVCLTEMKQYFTKNFDNMVYRKYNTKETEQGVNMMWQDIKAAFKDSLQSEPYKWIREDTRKYALEKLNAMKMEIVSYEHYTFSSVFERLSVDSQDYVGNLKSYLSLEAAQKRSEIDEPPIPIDLSEQLSTTPANVLIENVVKVPVSLLQPNYAWSASFPNAFNFAVLGALLSHELIHGFDDTGRHHDLEGNALDWWDEDSANDFNDRAKCFNQQYQSFVFQGEHLPDMPSQSENIADNGGVRLAYAAYLKWYESALAKDPTGVIESMPGLSFTTKKLFFISYGQLWCGDVQQALRKLQASFDTHVPDKFRVNGPLTNFDEFSKEFNCPKGSGMNPSKKCEIY